MSVLSVFGAIYTLWFAGIAVIGSFSKNAAPPRVAPATRFAVLIPARNEAGVVGHLVRSLMNQEYPRKLFDVIVIPNGCKDDTAEVARAAGAVILECDTETHSKGDVLRFAFDRLDSYDAYCILDADNLAAPGFLRAANDAMAAGWEIAQGFRDSKNPSDSWTAGDMSMFFWIMNRFYNRTRAALGMSAALNGTGIVMSASLINRLGWNVKTLTEDLEFSGVCAINGVKIGYMENAVIYDEQPLGLWASMVQRRRWFSGTIQCLRAYGFSLIKTRTVHAADVMFVYGGCVMQLIGMISAIVTVWQTWPMLMRGEIPLAALIALGAGAYLACSVFALILCTLEGKISRRRIPAILMFPVFLISWMPANIWAMFTPPPGWTHIDHVCGTDAADE